MLIHQTAKKRVLGSTKCSEKSLSAYHVPPYLFPCQNLDQSNYAEAREPCRSPRFLVKRTDIITRSVVVLANQESPSFSKLHVSVVLTIDRNNCMLCGWTMVETGVWNIRLKKQKGPFLPKFMTPTLSNPLRMSWCASIVSLVLS